VESCQVNAAPLLAECQNSVDGDDNNIPSPPSRFKPHYWVFNSITNLTLRISWQESDAARLEQQLQNALQLVKEAEKRADEERRRTDEEHVCAKEERGRTKEAEKRADEEQRNRQEAESKIRFTTFEEYIYACHTLLSRPLNIQTDKSLSTQGSITSINNKRCPNLLKPWTDFPVVQQQLFEKFTGLL